MSYNEEEDLMMDDEEELTNPSEEMGELDSEYEEEDPDKDH